MIHVISIETINRPKMDWHGEGHRYVCTCGRIGDWQIRPQVADRSGQEHASAKNDTPNP